jgi:hypothetical protein
MPVFIIFSCIYLFFAVPIHFVAQVFISIIKITLLYTSVQNFLNVFKVSALEVHKSYYFGSNASKGMVNVII